MADTDVLIQRISIINMKEFKGYSFIFRCVSDWNVKKYQSVISIPFVNRDAENNFLFRFSGQVEEVSFNFVFYDDGETVGTGTITFDQQVQYIRSELFTEEFDTTWEITQAVYYPTPTVGVITNLEISQPSGHPGYATGRITIMLGRIGLL